MKVLYMCAFFLNILVISGLAYYLFRSRQLDQLINMANSRFIYSILAAFITGMLLLIFIQYNSSRSIDQLIDGNRMLLNDMRLGNDLREMERDILSVESKIRAAVATGDSGFVRDVDRQTAEAIANLDTLPRMGLDTGSTRDIARLLVLARDRQQRKNILVDSFLRQGRKPPPSLIADTRMKGAANEINGIMRRLYERRKERLAAISAVVTKYGRIAKTSGTILIVLVLLTGSALFWFIINRIQKQNDLIRRLDTSERQLQDALRIKENFLANMSHEIRTPLNSVIGFTRLLEKQPLDAGSREFVEAIGTSGKNLLTIINDILDLSKIEAGMMRLEAAPFDPRQLFDSVATLFRSRIAEKGLAFETLVGEEVPAQLMGDATRLTQIVVNLIGNAVKFTDAGTITVRVSSRAEAGDRVRLIVEVRDTGIGISARQQAAIFERFSQAEGSTTRKYGGTGLGLAIVKELVDLQHGAIAVESEPGMGSCFRIEIPYAEVLSQPTATTPAASSTRPQLSGISVLVADDNRMNQRLMEHLLTSAGIAFDIVDDGTRVISRLQEKKYDLVLMDIQMPEMDGYSASRAIRDDLQLRIPIIAMTAHAMRGEREKCLESGMNEYLSKPIDAAQLFDTIASLVHRNPPSLSPTTGPAKEPAGYRYIDLDYLHELSAGDGEYEIEMVGQFLATMPEELQQLEAALSAGDRAAAARIAHNMKTTVSIMGLADRLSAALDTLEFPDAGGDPVAAMTALRRVCDGAAEEARQFLLRTSFSGQ